MITIVLINLIGVTIHVMGIGLCLRGTKRTGNQGYLLLAAYFAAVLVASSMEQVRRMQAGPAAVESLPAQEQPQAQVQKATEEGAEQCDSPVAGDISVPEEEAKGMPVVADSPWESVSPPILPAILLAGVFIVLRDDPRRAPAAPEPEADAAAQPSADGESAAEEQDA